MRKARVRYDLEMSYYHLMNRVAGEADHHPFGPVEKEKLFAVATEVSRSYSLDLLSVVAMGSHWHIVCAAPADALSRDEVVARWRATHPPDKAEPNWDDPDVLAKHAFRMRDISCFVQDFERRFTRWFNATRPSLRRGGLWMDRFRSVLLDKDTALWDCLTYVEMNPVRAGLAESPADYRFCTWGRMAGSGTHPFAANLVRHLRHYLGEKAEAWSDERVIAELATNLARIAAGERGENSQAIAAAEEAARTGRGHFILTVRRRVRYWTDGALIGSELFVREMAAKVIDAKRAARKHLAEGHSPGGPDEAPVLFAYRCLAKQN